MSETIELRQTRRYVGTFQHLDQWTEIGEADVYMREAEDCGPEDEPDLTEPRVQHGLVHMTRIGAGVTAEQVKKALADTFSKHDCHHEYDCCWCRSYSATADHICGPIFKLTITSSRNF